MNDHLFIITPSFFENIVSSLLFAVNIISCKFTKKNRSRSTAALDTAFIFELLHSPELEQTPCLAHPMPSEQNCHFLPVLPVVYKHIDHPQRKPFPLQAYGLSYKRPPPAYRKELQIPVSAHWCGKIHPARLDVPQYPPAPGSGRLHTPSVHPLFHESVRCRVE